MREVFLAFILLLCIYQLRMTGPELLINMNGLLCGKIKTYTKEGKYISESPASASSTWDLKCCGSTTGQDGSLWVAFDTKLKNPENNFLNGR